MNRDRPASDPGGLECEKCGCIFVGEPWHKFCAVCIKEVEAEMFKEQHRQPDQTAGEAK